MKTPISDRQLGFLSYRVRRFTDRLPPQWKAGAKPNCDWRTVNFENWLRDNVGKNEATTIISAFIQDDERGIEALKNHQCPIV